MSAPATSAPGAQAGSVWTGRAVGPLSRLLPGGSVDSLVDDAPGEERPAPAAGVPGTTPVLAGRIEPSVAPLVAGSDKSADTTATVESGGVTESSDVAAPDDVAESDDVAARGDSAPGDVGEVADAGEPLGAAVPVKSGLASTDDRWHEVLVGFVDDPRGSVEAASALIDEEIARHIALLSQRKEAVHANWRGADDVDTEALRVCLVNYRDMRKRLADVVAVLSR